MLSDGATIEPSLSDRTEIYFHRLSPGFSNLINETFDYFKCFNFFYSRTIQLYDSYISVFRIQSALKCQK